MPPTEPVPLSDFVAAGYFATRLVPRPDWMPAGLLPAKVITLAEHLNAVLPGDWLLEGSGDRVAARRKALQSMGIAPERLQEVLDWALPRFGSDWGMDGVCFSPAFPVEAARRFLPDDDDTAVLGLALTRRFADELLTQAQDDVRAGVQPELAGIPAMVQRRAGPHPGGRAIGYDFYPWYTGLGCSWLCEQIQEEASAELGLVLNEHGLVASLSEAESVTRWLRTRGARGELEPGLWLPWQVLRYR